MGSFSSKSKSTNTSNATSTTAPLAPYSPYVDQGLAGAQSIFQAQQPSSAGLGTAAMSVYNGLTPATATLNNIYSGTNPSQSTFSSLAGATANDPSMATLQQLAAGSQNPANSILQSMTGEGVNPDSSQFYKDTLAGKYLTGNPYLDNIVQQGTDAATKAQNQRFALSGMDAGMSTPYSQALGGAVADANNQLRYTAYNNELNRMGTIGGQSDSEYNATNDRNLSAANDLASSNNADRAAQLAAAQGLGSQYNADNTTSLAAATGLTNSELQALGLMPNMAGAQLGALAASTSLPYANTSNYANLVNGLTAKYGSNTGTSNSTGTTTSTPGLFDWMKMWGQNAGNAAAAGA